MFGFRGDKVSAHVFCLFGVWLWLGIRSLCNLCRNAFRPGTRCLLNSFSLMPQRKETSCKNQSYKGLDFMHLRATMNEISCHCEQCLDTVHSVLFESDCM